MYARKLIVAAMDTTIAAIAAVKHIFRICIVPVPDLPIKNRRSANRSIGLHCV